MTNCSDSHAQDENGQLLALFEDHYWDSLEKDKDIVLLHVKSVLRAASQGAFAGSDIASDEREISGHAESQRSEPGKAGVDGSIPSRSTTLTPRLAVGLLLGVQDRVSQAIELLEEDTPTPPALADRDAIARAIYDVENRWIAPNFPDGHKFRAFEDLDDREQRLHFDYADAVLALRTPAGSSGVDAYEYAKNLLVSFVEEHCDPVPQWKPNDDLIGILVQFDNALCVTRSIKAERDDARAEAAQYEDAMHEKNAEIARLVSQVENASAIRAAAETWWANKRPIGWSDEAHANNPTVNCSTPSEKALAKAAALSVSSTMLGASPLMEASQAQHIGLKQGEPAKFTRNGKLETCQCRDCRSLSPHVGQPK